jgi:hypothetical protein
MSKAVVLSVVLGLGFSSLLVTAQTPPPQCGGRAGGQIFSCTSSGCSGQYEEAPPIGSTYQWSAFLTQCCGKLVWVWTTDYSACNRLPEKTQATAALLARHGIDVRIRDCQGNLTPYTLPEALSTGG